MGVKNLSHTKRKSRWIVAEVKKKKLGKEKVNVRKYVYSNHHIGLVATLK